MRYQICLIWIVLLLVLNPAIAQEKTNQPEPQMSTNLVSSVHKMDEATSSKEQIIILREQNKIIREYNGSLLSTVHWALAGIFGIAALLAGFSWWTNSKLYAAEKSRFREEVNSQIKEMDSRLAIGLEASRTEFLRLAESRIDANVNRLLKDIYELKNHVEIVKSDIEESISSVGKDIEVVRGDLKVTQKSISIAEWDLRSVEKIVWDIRGVPLNILATQYQALEAALKIDEKWRIESILNEIKKTLKEKVIGKNETLPNDIPDLMIALLNRATDYNPILVSEIIQIIRKLPIKDDVDKDVS
jgi:hypothetical protein